MPARIQSHVHARPDSCPGINGRSNLATVLRYTGPDLNWNGHRSCPEMPQHDLDADDYVPNFAETSGHGRCRSMPSVNSQPWHSVPHLWSFRTFCLEFRKHRITLLRRPERTWIRSCTRHEITENFARVVGDRGGVDSVRFNCPIGACSSTS